MFFGTQFPKRAEVGNSANSRHGGWPVRLERIDVHLNRRKETGVDLDLEDLLTYLALMRSLICLYLEAGILWVKSEWSADSQLWSRASWTVILFLYGINKHLENFSLEVMQWDQWLGWLTEGSWWWVYGWSPSRCRRFLWRLRCRSPSRTD